MTAREPEHLRVLRGATRLLEDRLSKARLEVALLEGSVALARRTLADAEAAERHEGELLRGTT
jgi:hypothetical protein